MYKLVLVVFIIIIGIWILSYQTIPAEVRHSRVGSIVDAAFFKLQYKAQLRPQKYKYYDQIVKIEPEKYNQIMQTLVNADKPAVIYFYDTNCFQCRYLLRDINALAKQHAGDTLFVVIAFDDDKRKISFLLDKLDDLHFRPIEMEPGAIEQIRFDYAKLGMRFTDIPVVAYKYAGGSRQFVLLGADIGTKRYIEDAMKGERQ